MHQRERERTCIRRWPFLFRSVFASHRRAIAFHRGHRRDSTSVIHSTEDKIFRKTSEKYPK